MLQRNASSTGEEKTEERSLELLTRVISRESDAWAQLASFENRLPVTRNSIILTRVEHQLCPNTIQDRIEIADSAISDRHVAFRHVEIVNGGKDTNVATTRPCRNFHKSLTSDTRALNRPPIMRGSIIIQIGDPVM